MKRARQTGGQKNFRPKKKAKATKTVSVRALAGRLELKNFDNNSTNNLIAGQATAVVNSIFSPDQGTAPTEHIGRSLTATSLEYNFSAVVATTTTGDSAIRVAIVYDRQPNAALATATDVWTTDTITSMPNLNNKKRFKVLVDDKNDGISDQGPGSVYMNGYRKFKIPLETEFNNTNGGTIADITTGSYISFVWTAGTFVTANPTNSLYTRIRFTDG